MSRKYKSHNWKPHTDGEFTQINDVVQLKNGRFVGYGHEVMNCGCEWLVLAVVKDRSECVYLVASNFEGTLFLNPDLCS